MRASEAIPLNHSRSGDPEYCCSGGQHNYHFRPGAPKTPGHLIWCCCKSVLTEIEPELEEWLSSEEGTAAVRAAWDIAADLDLDQRAWASVRLREADMGAVVYAAWLAIDRVRDGA